MEFKCLSKNNYFCNSILADGLNKPKSFMPMGKQTAGLLVGTSGTSLAGENTVLLHIYNWYS